MLVIGRISSSLSVPCACKFATSCSIKRDLSDLRKTQRYMAKGLEHEFLFDKDYIRDIACSDEIDQAILNLLRHAPATGILPKDIAREVHGITPWQVILRIRRMNKRLDRQIGQKVAEKRGLHWALTSFAETSWEESSN